MKIGVIGSKGDLGSQLVSEMRRSGLEVIECDLRADTIDQSQLVALCDIIHLCVSVEWFTLNKPIGENKILVLHDSVMRTSQMYSDTNLDSNGSVVHMLMNEANSVVIARGTPGESILRKHFSALGYNTHILSIDEHDQLMAQSQAPLALLIKALHIPLKEQYDQGLLTPSGELLMKTLDSRATEWTPETIHSILKNPMLDELIARISDAHKNE